MNFQKQIKKYAGNLFDLLYVFKFSISFPPIVQMDGFTNRQVEALTLIKQGENVFITGPGGVGKSFLVAEIVRLCGEKVIITAMTGKAAVGIGGLTIHSVASAGMIDKPIKELLRKRSKFAGQSFRACKVLLIDEISMLSPLILYRLHRLAQYDRKSTKFFGGLQVVVFGDFLQLPPISKLQIEAGFDVKEVEANPIKYLFEYPLFSNNFRVVYLTEVIRQTNQQFCSILNRMRVGECHNSDLLELYNRTIDNGIVSDAKVIKRRLDRPIACEVEDTTNLPTALAQLVASYVTELLPTKLFAGNDKADEVNMCELAVLKSTQYEFNATYHIFDGAQRTTVNTWAAKFKQIEPMISLKAGARVLLIRNINVAGGLANGASGTILSFNENKLPIVQFDLITDPQLINWSEWNVRINSHIIAICRQIPLKLGYAITIHKSQGMTIDVVQVDCNKIFQAGQAYTAFSRVRSIKGLTLVNFMPSCIIVNQLACQYYRNLEKPGPKKRKRDQNECDDAP